LFDRIVHKGKYSEDQARRVMRRLLAAVYYLHEDKNVVHRDLKPENILMLSKESDIDIQVTDFGLAKAVNSDGLKTFCGTPMYFAPEILQRRHTVMGRGRYGKEADCWSMGIILYILLSGMPPFDPDSRDTTIDYPDEHWGGVSDKARDLVQQLLIVSPKKRLTVKDACQHEWILQDDGDTHQNPLDDPNLVRTPQKRLFGSDDFTDETKDNQVVAVNEAASPDEKQCASPTGATSNSEGGTDQDKAESAESDAGGVPKVSLGGRNVKAFQASSSSAFDVVTATVVQDVLAVAVEKVASPEHDGLAASATSDRESQDDGDVLSSPEVGCSIPKVSLGGRSSDAVQALSDRPGRIAATHVEGGHAVAGDQAASPEYDALAASATSDGESQEDRDSADSPEVGCNIPKVSLGGRSSEADQALNDSPDDNENSFPRCPREPLTTMPLNKIAAQAEARINLRSTLTEATVAAHVVDLKSNAIRNRAVTRKGAKLGVDMHSLSAELAEDEIMSDFSEKTESISSFGEEQRPLDAPSNEDVVEKPAFLAAERPDSANGNRRLLDDTPRLEPRDVGKCPKKRKSRKAVVNQDGASSPKQAEKRKKASSAVDEEICSGKQTTLSSFFTKRT
jgi:hypothetical protein